MAEDRRATRRREYYRTQSPDFTPINTADGEIDLKKKDDDDKVDDKKADNGSVESNAQIKPATDQLESVEGGDFKDLQKRINLSDNPAERQRLQNRKNELVLKKGFQAENIKARGEKRIERKKYGIGKSGKLMKQYDQMHEHIDENRQKQEQALASHEGKWDLAEKEAKLDELDRQWRSDLPTSKKGSSYFQSTRPKPSLNAKSLGTDYYKEGDYKPFEDLDVMSQQVVDRDKPEFSIAPFAHKFDTSPLNISLTTPIRQAKRDTKFKNIAQGLNE
tara:strand:+ start:33 stop:860 length:828 start_codon:yes stop_codon:yes gene_type:complete